ncbi:MAG: Uma2 family endonuclease [bacterium]|nr:Uma2 family endonuclease [bacterium]
MVSQPTLETKTRLTSAACWAFVSRPENAERHFELVDGEIVEKAGAFIPSEVAANAGFYVKQYLLSNSIGRVTGADGTYHLSDEDEFIPDVAYISKTRMPERPERGAPVPPELAVEVKSLTDTRRQLRRKAERYLQLGTLIVWLIFPEDRVVEVYSAKLDDVVTVAVDGQLSGEDVLPGFVLPVSAIFEESV